MIHGLLRERGSQLQLDALSDYARRLDDATHKAEQRQSAACAELLAFAATGLVAMEIPREVFPALMDDRSFRLFINFLNTDRLMEDRVRDETTVLTIFHEALAAF